MADFNDNLRSISAETKALQAVHLTAKTRSRQEMQKLDTLKAEIAELTTNRDVSHCLILLLALGHAPGDCANQQTACNRQHQVESPNCQSDVES